MIRFITFHPSHVAEMRLREWDRLTMAMQPELAEYSAAYFQKHGFGLTALADDGIVGAAGVVQVLPGNWEVWSYTTELFPKYGFAVHRSVKRFLDAFTKRPNWRRYQCVVDSTHPVAVRWVEALGLEREGTLRKYGPNGEDYHQYARIQ